MTAILVVLLFVVFVVTDVVVRVASRRIAEKRARQEREAVLHESLRLDFTHEAPSLKRVEVAHPLARILAVDDEPVILDSFRKILVLAGFDVDTVENGPEALGLVQRRSYDFVFTDLKMPGMDGVAVVKAVKHLRPDVDVAVITGYATVESAVETMRDGAVDYVQKPFTEDELVEFAKRLLIKREARLEAERLPTVRVVAPAAAESAPPHEFCIPGGAFISSGHVWARIEGSGQVRLGMDDFARKALGPIEGVELPVAGTVVRPGDPLFKVRRGGSAAVFLSPLSGRVVTTNGALAGDAPGMMLSPYARGWVCLVEPSDLAAELPSLRIGKPVVAWYQQEIQRLRGEGTAAPRGAMPADWAALEREFLSRAEPTRVSSGSPP